MSNFFYILCFAEMRIGCPKASAEGNLRNDVFIIRNVENLVKSSIKASKASSLLPLPRSEMEVYMKSGHLLQGIAVFATYAICVGD